MKALRKAKPELSRDELAQHLTKKAAVRVASVGAAAGIPGGALGVLAMAPDIFNLVLQQSRLVLSIAFLYDKKPHLRQRFREVLATLAVAMGAAASRTGMRLLIGKGILTVHEIAEFDSQRVLVTEFVDGETLRERIARRLKIGEALELIEQVLAALSAAHEVGVIHRDIKPENIMIRRDGIAKVVDFGLAKLIQPHAELASSTTETTPALVMGTTPYMSPEQLSGDPVDARTDLWSIGVILYEMVAQRRPFEGRTTTQVASLILQKDPPPLSAAAPEVPHELERIVRKALQKKPDQRYQTAKDLLIDLKELRRETETSPRRLRLPRVAVSLRRGIVVAMAALAVTAGVLLFQAQRAPALTTKDTIVLADFENHTGDPVFDGTLKQALAVQLGQSPYLNILPEEQVLQTLQTMGRPPGERVTPTVAREICERQGVKAMLTGSIAQMGSNYVIALEAVNGRTGDSLARELVEAPRKEEVIRALGEGASKLRKELGESLNSIQKFERAP